MAGYDQLPERATLRVEPYKLHVSDDQVTEFYTLLKLSRLAPETYENLQTDVNRFGVTHSWMKDTKNHWLTSYRWRDREAYFNSFPNFKTSIEDEDDGNEYEIHFAALFSEKQDAVPVVFLHGWPGSFLEFLGVMSVFKGRYKPKDLPYHIIVPSLPGYALSSGPPCEKNFKVEDIARIINKLMCGLGFESGYVAQGGDIGSYTCRALSTYHPCKAIHLNFCLMDEPDGHAAKDVDDVETQGLKRAEDFKSTQSAYALEHGTRPATIGFVLDSSPIAVLAWIGEKFLTWTDTTPPLDDILDSITLYWFTQSFPRCIFPYRQFHFSTGVHYLIHGDPKYNIKQPLGYSYFPKELAPAPKSWVASTGNLVWYKRHDQGGHFAAMEKPELMVEDVEDFIKKASSDGRSLI